MCVFCVGKCEAGGDCPACNFIRYYLVDAGVMYSSEFSEALYCEHGVVTRLIYSDDSVELFKSGRCWYLHSTIEIIIFVFGTILCTIRGPFYLGARGRSLGGKTRVEFTTELLEFLEVHLGN